MLENLSRFPRNLADPELEAKLLRVAPPSRAGDIGNHVHEHLVRFRLLFDSVGSGGAIGALLDVGGTGNLLPMYLEELGCSFVAMANKWRSISLDPEYLAKFISPDRFRCDYFDAEAEQFPYNDGIFDTAVCSEVIEHLRHDPAHMLREINRVLKPGGRLILSTPNITSINALYRLLGGLHPQAWSAYTGTDADRHNREYTPSEILRLLQWAGFGEINIQTFSLEPIPFKVRLISFWTFLPWALRGQGDMFQHRGEYILAVASKQQSVPDNPPQWLYD